jgi:hypothetical protein
MPSLVREGDAERLGQRGVAEMPAAGADGKPLLFAFLHG